MKEKIQSRRQFFKKAAKGALPILGAIVLTQVPVAVNATTRMGCDNGCEAGCSGCSDGCTGCSGGCSDECTGCTGGCSGCSDGCTASSRN